MFQLSVLFNDVQKTLSYNETHNVDEAGPCNLSVIQTEDKKIKIAFCFVIN